MLATSWKIGDKGHTEEHNKIALRVNRSPSVTDYADWNAAISGNPGGCLYVPPGIYAISAPVVIANDIEIDAALGAVLKASAPMDFVLGSTVPQKRVILRGLQIDGNGLAVAGLSLYYAYPGSLLEGLQVRGAVGDGVLLQFCMCMEARDILSSGNSGHGFNLQGCNATALYTCRSTGNGGNGYLIAMATRGEAAYTGNVSLFGMIGEGNAGNGIHIQTVQNPFYLAGGWIELNGLDGIRCEESIGTITGQRISGAGTGTNYAIHLLGGHGVCVTGNKIAVNPGSDTSYLAIRDETGIAAIHDNWNGGAGWIG